MLNEENTVCQILVKRKIIHLGEMAILRNMYSKNKSYWLSVLLLSLLGALIMIKGINPLDDFIYTHWLFNYELEFVKRGLPGEILRQLGIYPSPAIISVLSLMILGGLILFFIYVLVKKTMTQTPEKGLVLFAIVAVTHSTTIASISRDLGRFDALLLILTIFTLNVIPSQKRWQALLTVFGVSCIAILIHEIYFIAFLPMILMYWVFIDPGYFHFNLMRGGLIVLLTILTYWVGTAGSMTSMSQPEYYNLLHQQFGENVSSGVYILFNDLTSNIQYTLERSSNWERLLHHVVMFLVFLPTFYFFGIFFNKINRNGSIKWKNLVLKMLPIAACSPLILYPLGHDHFRWWSLAITNIFLVIIFLADKNYIKDCLNTISWNKRYILFLTILLSLIFGHLGVTSSFEMVDKILLLADKFTH